MGTVSRAAFVLAQQPESYTLGHAIDWRRRQLEYLMTLPRLKGDRAYIEGAWAFYVAELAQKQGVSYAFLLQILDAEASQLVTKGDHSG